MIRVEKRWPAIVWGGVLSLFLSTASLEAQVGACPITTDDADETDFTLLLPAGQEEIVCTIEITTKIPRPTYASGEPQRRKLMFYFQTANGGLYEASAKVNFDTTSSLPAGVEVGQQIGSMASVASVGGATLPVPRPLRAGVRDSWNKRQSFVGTSIAMELLILDDLPEDYEDIWYVPMIVPMEITMVLRRLKDRCFMHTTVTGGSSSGIYSGDVAVLGNPTGVSDETLDMWFPTEAGAQFQAMQDALTALSGPQGIPGATAEEMEQLQAMYKNMGAAAEQADPVREIREMLTLTLEDVKFDAVPPGSSLDALMRMAGHFVLSAQLDTSDEVIIGPGAFSLPVTKVGVKVPGLGLASTESSCGTPSNSPTVLVKMCDPDDVQGTLDLDELGAVCGEVKAWVFNEQCKELTVSAEFLAGRSIEQCIR